MVLRLLQSQQLQINSLLGSFWGDGKASEAYRTRYDYQWLKHRQPFHVCIYACTFAVYPRISAHWNLSMYMESSASIAALASADPGDRQTRSIFPLCQYHGETLSISPFSNLLPDIPIKIPFVLLPSCLFVNLRRSNNKLWSFSVLERENRIGLFAADLIFPTNCWRQSNSVLLADWLRQM